MEPSKSYSGHSQHSQQYPTSPRIPSRNNSTRTNDERERRERELREREREKKLLREREKEKERMLREREKAAAQVSAGAPPKKKPEQRASTMTDAQVMEKLRMYFNVTYGYCLIIF